MMSVEEQNGTERVVINIENVIMSITKKDAVIFCRVSSFGQTGPFSISFEVQEHKGHVCANLFKLKVVSTVKIVESAYDGKACTIKTLISKYRGKNIIIYNVSRFSRNVARGMELLDYALKCNTRLFFVDEGIVWDKNHTGFRGKIRERLHMAEQESAAIGHRVKDALAEKKRRGYFTGGTPKYGYTVVNADGGRRAVEEPLEQKVIKFINMCRETGTSVVALNEMMQRLSPDFDAPIVLGYGEDEVVTLQEALSFSEIAGLLNAYGVTRRGSRWNASIISSIVRRNYIAMLDAMEDMEIGEDGTAVLNVNNSDNFNGNNFNGNNFNGNNFNGNNFNDNNFNDNNFNDNNFNDNNFNVKNNNNY